MMRKTVLSILKVLLIWFLVIALPIGIFLGVNIVAWKIYNHQADTIIRPKAEAYLQEQYADPDLEITECYWHWYDNCFYVEVNSKTSQDTHFTLTYSTWEKELGFDSYERMVLGRRNTHSRIQDTYRDMAKQAVSGMQNPTALLSYCYLRASDWSELELDKTYDAAEITEFGRQYGDITIKLDESEDNLNLDCALEYLTELDRLLEENGAAYNVLEITLECKEGTEKSSWKIYDVTHEDLTCEDPRAVLQEKWDQQEAHRQELYASWHKN